MDRSTLMIMNARHVGSSGVRSRADFRRMAILPVLVVLWLLAVGAGLRSLLKYSNTPGQIASPSTSWPKDIGIGRSPGRHSLLLFVHPECACSRASIEEAAHISTCCNDRVEIIVLFLTQPGDPLGWSRSDVVKSAARIPGVRTLQDPDGSIARRFGARTSGQALLYDARGGLRFNGGITVRRGHSGDNDGRATITSFLLGLTPKLDRTPVFGCALFSGRSSQ